MDVQNDNTRRVKVIRYGFVLAIIMIACVMIFTTQSVVNQGMRSHQLKMMDMVALRITENMNHYFQGQWDNIQYVQNTLRNRSFTNEEEILECLDEEEDSMKGSYDELLLLLIDQGGFLLFFGCGEGCFMAQSQHLLCIHRAGQGKVGEYQQSGRAFYEIQRISLFHKETGKSSDSIGRKLLYPYGSGDR